MIINWIHSSQKNYDCIISNYVQKPAHSVDTFMELQNTTFLICVALRVEGALSSTKRKHTKMSL